MQLFKTRGFLIGAAILVVGVIGFGAMVLLRPKPPKIERAPVRPLVVVSEVAEESGSLTVAGNGTVRASTEINVIAEVSGKLSFVSRSFVSGGSFRSGEVLARIDDEDYRNAVAAAEAEVTARQLELILAREESDVARADWERLKRRTGRDVSPDSTNLGSLVFKEPQVRLAEAQLRAAEARLADARLRLDRTRIRAPFDGQVRTESVDVGQFVAPGQVLGVLYGTETVEISIPLPSRDAALIPGLMSGRLGASKTGARVFADFGGETLEWKGLVDRSEGLIDPATRTVNVVIRVSGKAITAGGERVPLLLGMFTTAEIEGRRLDRFFRLPIEALRERDVVWVVVDDALRIRPVEVIQETDGEVVVTSGVAAGDKVIVNDLTVITDGMMVRIAQ